MKKTALTFLVLFTLSVVAYAQPVQQGVRPVNTLPPTCVPIGAANSDGPVRYQGTIYHCTATNTWTKSNPGQLPTSTYAGLPTCSSGNDGQLVRVTDANRDVYSCYGTSGKWVSRNGGVYNVMDFGAKGNGTTDDTAAIANATTAANGGTLVIPPGASGNYYKITAEVTLPVSVTVQGDGAEIRQATAGKSVFVGDSMTYAAMRGITLKGVDTTTSPSVSYQGLIHITNSSSVEITNVKVSTFKNGISVVGSNKVLITWCQVTTFRIYGIMASQSNSFVIDRNVIDGSVEAGAQNAYGISATGNTSGGAPQAKNSISFNRINNIESWDGIMTHEASNTNIIGNVITDVRTGIDITASSSTNTIDSIVIAGNILLATTTDTWIGDGTGGINVGIIINGYDASHLATNIAISGNTINGFNTLSHPATVGAGGIQLTHVGGVSVSGNVLYGIGVGTHAAPSGGIFLGGTANDIILTGNSVLGGVVLYGIRSSSHTGNSLVINGFNFQTTGATGSAFGYRAISSTLSSIVAQSIITNATTDYYDTGSTVTKKRILADGAITQGASANLSLTDSGGSFLNYGTSSVAVGSGSNIFRISGTEMGRIDSAGLQLGGGASIANSNTIATITSGSGAPGTTPGRVGLIYCDTTGGKVYISTGTSSSSDWKILN